jgi:acetyltransferase-like isoleucine patch superfamily enzyme
MNNLENLAKIQIYFSALIKLLRGYVHYLLFKKKTGPFFLGKNVSILNHQYISIGKNVKFEKNSEIQGLSLYGLIFEDNVTIGHTCMIRPSSYYGTGEIGEGLIMKKNSSIGPFGYIGCAGKVEIGKNVIIGPRVSIFAENHNFKDRKRPIKNQGISRKGIIIENDCWIGSGVIILDGVTIGHGTVIGAGTVITKDISPNSKVFDKRNNQSVSR